MSYNRWVIIDGLQPLGTTIFFTNHELQPVGFDYHWLQLTLKTDGLQLLLYTVNCALYTVHCTLYILQRTSYTVH